MGDLFALAASQPARLVLSTAALARPDSPADGWGVAWYEGADAQLLREARLPSRSKLAQFVGRHELHSPLVVAHRRQATVGAPALCNTAPFAREQGGRMHVFAHVGHLEAIAQRDPIALHPEAPETEICHRPIGETDSEHAFALLLARLRRLPRRASAPLPSLELRFRLLHAFAEQLRSYGPATFLYTDGSTLFVHADRLRLPDGAERTPALWLRELHAEAGAFETAGLHLAAPLPQRVLLFATSPLDEQGWRPLAEGTLLAVESARVRARAAPGSPPVFELELPG